MKENSFDQGRGQPERLQNILPDINRFGHPYCDKNDNFWYRCARSNTRLVSNLFDITRNMPVYSYCRNRDQIQIGDPIDYSNIFTHITPDLVSFAGLLNGQPWLFSRPAESNEHGLVFPHLSDLRENNYNPYGVYFAIRRITGLDNDLRSLAQYLSSFNR